MCRQVAITAELTLGGCGSYCCGMQKPSMAYRSWTTDENHAGCSKSPPARPQRVKVRGVPLVYVEGLNDARALHEKWRVSVRQGRAGEKSGFFSILLRDDVAHKIVQRRIGNLDFDEFPRCGCPIINIHHTVDFRGQPFMASLKQ